MSDQNGKKGVQNYFFTLKNLKKTGSFGLG